jgi:hypothetical protein
MANEVTLDVLNPRSELGQVVPVAPASRVASLAGKTVGVYETGKPGVENFYFVLDEMLRDKFPGIKTKRVRGPFQISEGLARSFAQEVDTFVYAWGD